MMEGVVFRDVWKSFGEHYALRGVSFHVDRGEVVGLLGPNVSGKSTLFGMTIGVLAPDSGEVLVGGVDPSKDPISARKMVGYMPEEPVLFESLKVEEFLEFVLSVYGVNVNGEQVLKVLGMLGIEGEAGKLVGELSHGNKRRVLLAALMLRDPPVLVLDEVFAGLDPVSYTHLTLPTTERV